MYCSFGDLNFVETRSLEHRLDSVLNGNESVIGLLGCCKLTILYPAVYRRNRDFSDIRVGEIRYFAQDDRPAFI